MFHLRKPHQNTNETAAIPSTTLSNQVAAASCLISILLGDWLFLQ